MYVMEIEVNKETTNTPQEMEHNSGFPSFCGLLLKRICLGGGGNLNESKI
jgi:hypothetical protein